MKFFRICCLLLALLMLCCAAVACGGDKVTETQPEETEADVKREPVNVHILVKDAKDGEVKYESGANGYDYEGETLTVQEILIEFMSFDHGVDVVVDDNGKLVGIGDMVADETQFWLFGIAKHPKGADQAEDVKANIDEYGDIANGDTIVVYLS